MNAYDLPRLVAYRSSLRALAALSARDDTAGPPMLEPLTPMPAKPRRVALLSGSFNPPTAAHLLLAERSLGAGFDAVVFVLPVNPAGKSASGLCPEDRLLALEASRMPGASIALCSHGLYVEQALAAAELLGDAEIVLLAGSDKLAQIFDPVWYADRDASLDALFARASILVAPRGDSVDQIRALLAEPRNREYARRVDVRPLHPAVSDLSSTRVRGLLASGSDSAGLVPPAVRDLCIETRAFLPPDPETGADEYALRARTLDLLWSLGEGDAALFRSLARGARENSSRGARLRCLLDRGDPAALELA